MRAKTTVTFAELYDFAVHKSPSIQGAGGRISKQVADFTAISSNLRNVTELNLSEMDFGVEPFRHLLTLTPECRSKIIALDFRAAFRLSVETMKLLLKGASSLNNISLFPNLNSLNFEWIRNLPQDPVGFVGVLMSTPPEEIYPQEIHKECDFLLKGKGTVTYPDGKKYEGEWIEGCPSGKGKMIYDVGGDEDEGVWLKGVFLSGLRLETFKDGGTSKEEWLDGEPTGKSMETYANGDKREGVWIEGFFNGQGTETFVDGSKYVGAWEEGEPHGQGAMTYANGDKYEGAWIEGLPSGQGVKTLANGDRYKGSFLKGNFEGKGVMTIFATGERLEGFWIEGQPCTKKRCLDG